MRLLLWNGIFHLFWVRTSKISRYALAGSTISVFYWKPSIKTARKMPIQTSLRKPPSSSKQSPAIPTSWNTAGNMANCQIPKEIQNDSCLIHQKARKHGQTGPFLKKFSIRIDCCPSQQTAILVSTSRGRTKSPTIGVSRIFIRCIS